MIDLLPSETAVWQEVESVARKHFARAGISEIRTPLLESTGLFSRGIGEGTDVVGKEMYTFFDRGNRSCTLRPEGTASVVRSIIQHGLVRQGVQRLWYSGPMFRYERPQAGRQRQFHQIGLETFGLDSPLADAEVIAIAWDLLKDLGIKNLSLEINSLGSNEDRKEYRNVLMSWLEEHFDSLDSDSQEKFHTNPLRILDTKNKETKELLLEAPLLNDALSIESKERFESVQQILISLEIPFQLNFHLVRGLDYYCHTAFEIISNELGAQSTVCGGGRYDGLVKQLGGPRTPAVGWGIGLERLIYLLGDSICSQKGPDAYVVNRGKQAQEYALVITRKLRLEDLSIELDSSGSSFSKQFKRADRSGARWSIILGEEEIKNQEIRLKPLKNLNNNKVETLSFSISDLSDLINFIKTS
tara:strand:- start:1589 stop:2833 length:1245 start_codon:yes stop_codon:yes gene_type:complete